MTRNAQIGVVVGVLAAIVVVSFVVSRSSKPTEVSPAASFNPSTFDAAAPVASAIPSVNPLVAAAADAGVTTSEMRGWRTRIDLELCPKGGEAFNKLEGRAPTDPKALNIVSLCLNYGNVTWYTCLLEAKDLTTGKSCNTRFLQPPPP